jgi:hypothetical protein
MLRFRTHAVGIVADVEKAFHHIELHESDRDFLRWLWLKDPTDPESEFIVYRFRVVPFGAKSSPFILNSTVIHHLQKESSPIAIDMQRSIFVDNIISGCDSREKAIEYYQVANEIMERAGLPLQAWGFSDVTIENQLKSGGRFDPCTTSKTLGLLWNRTEDSLNIQPVNFLTFCPEQATHRDVLRGVASLYDPLGFYTPLHTRGKILLQDLHKEKSTLDQQLSATNRDRWMEIVISITKAVDSRFMSVHRPYFNSIDAIRELHIFCDASRRAYGAVAYFLHDNKVSFVMSKSKISPIKDQTREGERDLSIPEAELMAAYIGTLLAETIIKALEPLGIKLRTFLWSDNQIVHFWISKTDGHPRPFITNRVKSIREFNRLRAATWKYVPTDQNPADILSRGASLKEFQASTLWKTGPTSKDEPQELANVVRKSI